MDLIPAPSPNFDQRRAPPDMIVLHYTGMPTGEGALARLRDPEAKVSSHYLVEEDGRVFSLVAEERRAWHAGVSVLDGVTHVNDFSVGIEMVNRNDGIDPYPDAQYEAVAGIIRFLRSHYSIPDSRIVSHAAIALPPGRKSDPLGFDFAKLCALAR